MATTKKAKRPAAKQTAKKPVTKPAAKATAKAAARTAKKPAKKPAGRAAATGARTATPRRATRMASGRRELIDTGSDKRYVRRRVDGTFKESDDVGRSLSADARHHAATDAGPGQGDRGD